MKIAQILPPWLPVPPHAYGGIEALSHGLINSLTQQGEQVTAFTVSGSRTAAHHQRWYYEHPQYHLIDREFNHVVGIAVNHLQYALNVIRQQADFDIIHDNTGMIVNLLAWANLDKHDYPPVLLTLHGPIERESDLSGHEAIGQAASGGSRLFFNGISNDQLARAPHSIRDRLIGVVYNGIDLNQYSFQSQKSDYFLTLARFTRGKGQGMAVKLCRELGANLRMAGSVGGLSSYTEIEAALDGILDAHANDDFIFFRDEILPFIDHNRIELVGDVGGSLKQDLISHAKALLFPISWPEPFGMAIIEALASGTPVVAMAKGALPEIIDHGVNGFLANSETEFKHYMERVGQIDPENCRKSVAEKFSIDKTATHYRQFYHQVIERASST